MRPSATRLIFVYGTLMHGEGNWSWALAPRRPKFLACTLPGDGFALYHLGSFPGMVWRKELTCPDAPFSIVHGEVFEIEEGELPKLDRLEGHPHFYRREKIRVLPPGEAADPIRVEAYLYQHEINHRTKLIPSGNWRGGFW